ncbi:MAG TPA: hypothetical protein VJC07_04215 [Candidatus Nanoarchaeia archaeon]|nr:hypothetical protein [Candidatus Nanoarchaeia archaeon]
MKRTIAILLIALLTIGIAPAYALVDADVDAEASIGTGDDGDGDADAEANAETKAEANSNSRANARSRTGLSLGIGNLGVSLGNNLNIFAAKRNVLGIDARMHQRAFLEARERHDIAVGEYNSEKKEFLRLKAELNSCDDAAECDEIRADVIASTKLFLEASIDRVSEHMIKIREQLALSEYISAEDLEEADARIEADLEALAELKAKVETADTEAEIRQYSAELREMVGEMKHRANLRTSQVLHFRASGLMHSISNAQVKIEKLDSYVQENNIEIDGWADLVADYNAEVEVASNAHVEAQAKMREAHELSLQTGNTEEVRMKVQESQELVHETQLHLRTAHQLLAEMIVKARQANIDVDAVAESEAEIGGEVQ